MTTPNAAEVVMKWRDLMIAGPKDRIDQLFVAIEQCLPPDWKRNTAAFYRSPDPMFCYVRKLDDCEVWLWLSRPSEYYVRGHLVESSASARGNEVVSEAILVFLTNVLEPAATAVGLVVGSGRLGPRSLVSGSVLDALWAFCESSRFDWPPAGDAVRKWREFVVRAYEDHAAFDLGELSAWLTGKGWSVDHAKQLIDRLISDVTLLVQYDELRQPA